MFFGAQSILDTKYRYTRSQVVSASAPMILNVLFQILSPVSPTVLTVNAKSL